MYARLFVNIYTYIHTYILTCIICLSKSIVSITAEGGKEDLERFSTRLALVERGKIYIKGLFDDSEGYPDASPALAGSSSDSEPKAP